MTKHPVQEGFATRWMKLFIRPTPTRRAERVRASEQEYGDDTVNHEC